MKTHYTGKLEPLTKEQQKNLDTHFAKIGKLVDRKGEREAHIVLTSVRFSKKAEVTMNYYGKQACGTATHKDQFLALLAAISKLEIQMQKLHSKWSDAKRHGDGMNGKKSPVPSAPAAPEPKAKKTNGAATSYGPAKIQRSAKPLTLEEAPLALKASSTYLLFEETSSGQVYIIARRADGGLDLIEAR
ncbi:HPF/RaiA family ribosome-associated protein [Bryobacter aggregatus]|uniref:HPF/RaiA family ribosome-associated protein n=1 Tax=Bryobacter aggregatus TaxID=360054 RepID=UPI0004E14A9A|nr:HPF/RaiA family ribosome-associated protein [Bryobacter aggregatus]